MTIDARRATQQERFIFQQVRRAEMEYARKLRKLAQTVIHTATEMLHEAATDEIFIQFAHMMDGYSNVIRPWAETVARKMLHDVSLRDMKAWRERSKAISWGLEDLVRNAPIGLLMQQRLDDQIGLITSIPRDIAKDVHQMAITTLYSGQRYAGIADMIMKKADTTLGRANLIARTEVARTTTEITRARSEYVGADSYIWRTVHDADVRPALNLSPRARANFIGSHRALDGKVFKWSEPPVSGQSGERAHPGQIYNCRCIPEIIIPGIEPDMRSWAPSRADQARWDAPMQALIAAKQAKAHTRRYRGRV